jgi:hypothetical protein
MSDTRHKANQLLSQHRTEGGTVTRWSAVTVDLTMTLGLTV